MPSYGPGIGAEMPCISCLEVLKGISFKITSGQSVGLVGPSGGGKSTVMSLLQRFYDPQEGTVLIGTQKLPLHSLNLGILPRFSLVFLGFFLCFSRV